VNGRNVIHRSWRSSPTAPPALIAALALCLAGAPLAAIAQAPAAAPAQDKQGGQSPARPTFDPNAMVTLDFADAELAQVIETIARATNRNFIYDDRVRGRVTIVSPEPIPVEQAYAVFESVLQVKGFTTVMTPGGAIKVIPVREAKESSIETVQSGRRPPNRDYYVTRLIPLRYIDADSIVNTLKPLVSKDAAMAAYPPTNTVILTESASNIRRLIQILESIDVETYKEDLAVINVEYADAATLADQVSEIYGAEVADAPGGAFQSRRAARRVANPADPNAPTAHKPPVRIITDERTNSLLVLAARPQLEEVRRLVAKLDVPVHGGGRIHVYYLNNANAEELAQTLSSLVGGGGGGGGGIGSSSSRSKKSRSSTTGGLGAGSLGGQTLPANGITGAQTVPAIQNAVAGLEGGISVTADPATNSLIIQASQEGFNTIAQVIEKLDVERPQVSVEALIMELTVNDNQNLGFTGLLRTINGDTDFLVASATSAAGAATGLPTVPDASGGLLARILRNTTNPDSSGNPTENGSVIDGILKLSATNGDINIVSAPHILTSDNEEAEIRVGDNIPIISSRVESAQGITTSPNGSLASSVNVERQDIGVTLRVTPQITEGNSLRLEIFQEITEINSSLQSGVGNVNDVGPALSNRRVENTVVVSDGETVVIGGLLKDKTSTTVTKAPWFGDIPILGWAFKSTQDETVKTNLLVFLTPRIVRTPLDLENDSIRRREDFQRHSGRVLELSDEDREDEAKRVASAKEQGVPYQPKQYENSVKEQLAAHGARYPLSRVKEIEEIRADERAKALEEGRAKGPEYVVQAATLSDPEKAAALLTDLIDSGHDGTLVSAPLGESVVYEIRLGPFATLQQANNVGEAVKRSHGLAPAILVIENEDKDKDKDREKKR
jgi:general secretion pathway protein D